MFSYMSSSLVSGVFNLVYVTMKFILVYTTGNLTDFDIERSYLFNSHSNLFLWSTSTEQWARVKFLAEKRLKLTFTPEINQHWAKRFQFFAKGNNKDIYGVQTQGGWVWRNTLLAEPFHCITQLNTETKDSRWQEKSMSALSDFIMTTLLKTRTCRQDFF